MFWCMKLFLPVYFSSHCKHQVLIKKSSSSICCSPMQLSPLPWNIEWTLCFISNWGKQLQKYTNFLKLFMEWRCIMYACVWMVKEIGEVHDLEDDPKIGQLLTPRNQGTVAVVWTDGQILWNDHKIDGGSRHINWEIICKILYEDLGKGKISTKFVPHGFTGEWKEHSCNMWRLHLYLSYQHTLP